MEKIPFRLVMFVHPALLLLMNGKTFLGHIKNSNSKTYLKNEWINAEAEVYGDSLIRHIINGDTVLTYTKPMIGEGFVSNTNSWTWAGITDSLIWINKANTPLKEGHIALQAESQPVDFRRIEILDLVGCTDPKQKIIRLTISDLITVNVSIDHSLAVPMRIFFLVT